MQDEMASLDNFGTIFLILRYDLSHDQRPHWEPRLLAIPSRPPQRVETSWGSTHSRLASSVLFGGLLSYAEPAAHNWCHRVRYIQAGRVANRASFGAKPQEPGRAAASSAEPSPGLRLVLVGFMGAFICRRQPSHDGGQKQSRTLPLRAVSPAAVSPLGTETGGGVTTGVITRRLNEGRLPSKKRQQSGRRKMEWSLPVAVYESPVNSELVAVIKHFSKGYTVSRVISFNLDERIPLVRESIVSLPGVVRPRSTSAQVRPTLMVMTVAERQYARKRERKRKKKEVGMGYGRHAIDEIRCSSCMSRYRVWQVSAFRLYYSDNPSYLTATQQYRRTSSQVRVGQYSKMTDLSWREAVKLQDGRQQGREPLTEETGMATRKQRHVTDWGLEWASQKQSLHVSAPHRFVEKGFSFSQTTTAAHPQNKEMTSHDSEMTCFVSPVVFHPILNFRLSIKPGEKLPETREGTSPNVPRTVIFASAPRPGTVYDITDRRTGRAGLYRTTLSILTSSLPPSIGLFLTVEADTCPREKLVATEEWIILNLESARFKHKEAGEKKNNVAVCGGPGCQRGGPRGRGHNSTTDFVPRAFPSRAYDAERQRVPAWHPRMNQAIPGGRGAVTTSDHVTPPELFWSYKSDTPARGRVGAEPRTSFSPSSRVIFSKDRQGP
ncbi:uncharacterized protein CLUP02_08654 [Colletotrichum lupini]|uniref:Uncharacterized protein n=1 Tax=Colletotrichum lupini TaxID=145971 RepID=A0A9Q8STI1_9PEZI|nr:uncharacterized protein CLUP02_08654 [Colletotrichum lupini]UQC83160.1 hypothetical protein CLUP02_08654 [Colletotrichum lupini]